ncbi:MAG: tyrosine-protein phosphatase [Candidatus Hydrothermia bacterium]
MRWIDLHSHILPGIDDGPGNMDESLRMADEALNIGLEKVFATPHVLNVSNIPAREKLKELARIITAKTGLQVTTGYEVHILSIVEGTDPMNLRMEGTNIVLVEFPLINEILAAGDYLSDLIKRGLTPLLAHPERYHYMNPYKLRKLVEMGVCTLANSGSFAGVHGREPKRRAECFLREGLVNAVASDAHGPGDYKKHGEIIKKLLKEGTPPELFAPEVEGAKKT